MRVGFICLMHKSAGTSRPNFNYINDFIHSLYDSCKRDFTLYLFDNASDEKYNIPNYPNIKYTYIEDQYERGMGVSNDGIKMAIEDECDVIIAVNDDVTFNESINVFIDRIRKHKDNGISLYGPLTNGIVGKSHQRAYRKGRGVREITELPQPYKILNGFLLGFTNEFYNKFKYDNDDLWDVSNHWNGGGFRLQKKVIKKKGKLFIVKECWIFHHKIRGWKPLLQRLKDNESKNKTKNTVRRKRATKR